TAMEVRQAVMELSCDWFQSRKPRRKPLGEYFAAAAREHWDRWAIADTSGKSLTYGRTLAGALALAGKLETRADAPTGHVGILLPSSVGGVLTNLALSLLGKIPVNLNYTASEESLRSAVAQCGITTIITSRAFLEKVPAL